MDGGTRADRDAPARRQGRNTSGASQSPRCGWCGLLPLPEDQALLEDLCSICFDILQDADWKSLLSLRALAVAK